MVELLPERRASGPARRWDPASELEEMTECMRRMLGETFGGLAWQPQAGDGSAWSPLVDIEEADDAYILEAELPGVTRENVNIEAVGNELTITGEIKERERKGTLRRQVRRRGRFEYRVRLGDQIEADKIEASLHEGVLTVRVPKSQRAERRRIEVKS